MTLHIITSCGVHFPTAKITSTLSNFYAGFGQQWSWTESKTTALPNGHRMSINETVLRIAHSPLVKLVLPRWLARWRKAWDNVFVAYDELQVSKTSS